MHLRHVFVLVSVAACGGEVASQSQSAAQKSAPSSAAASTAPPVDTGSSSGSSGAAFTEFAPDALACKNGQLATGSVTSSSALGKWFDVQASFLRTENGTENVYLQFWSVRDTIFSPTQGLVHSLGTSEVQFAANTAGGSIGAGTYRGPFSPGAGSVECWNGGMGGGGGGGYDPAAPSATFVIKSRTATTIEGSFDAPADDGTTFHVDFSAPIIDGSKPYAEMTSFLSSCCNAR